VSSARKAAEAHFRTPAKKLEWRPPAQDALEASLPDSFREQCQCLPLSRRRPAFLIVIAPTLEARQRIWNDVPVAWRPEVEKAVGLMLGAMLGTGTAASIERGLAFVPAQLIATVRKYAFEVWRKRNE
jgi:hypothetical protein